MTVVEALEQLNANVQALLEYVTSNPPPTSDRHYVTPAWSVRPHQRSRNGKPFPVRGFTARRKVNG